MPIRIRVIAAAIVALALLILPAAVQSQPSVPGLPSLPENVKGLPKAEVERFEVTLAGEQAVEIDFNVDFVPDVDCSLEGRGSLSERWNYQRGKGVVIAFRKLGPGVVILQREGRRLGDAAVAASGSLSRDASGSVITRTPIDCNSFLLRTAACERGFNVNSDLGLSWQKGKLTLEETSTAVARTKNPALGCGMSSVWNFDELGTSFPALYEQRGTLSMKKIFDSNANLQVDLKARYLPAADDPPGYLFFNEDLGGATSVTLKRLGDK